VGVLKKLPVLAFIRVRNDLFLTGVLKKPQVLDFIRVRNYPPILAEISEEDLFLTGVRNYPPVLAEISEDDLFLKIAKGPLRTCG
jgi:hypothetical protein